MSRPRDDLTYEEFCEQDVPRAKKARIDDDDGGDPMISDDEDGDHYGLVETGIANAGDSSPLPSGRGKKPWKVHRHTAGSMHSTNLYRHYRPDFRELAKEYPDTFGPHVTEDPDTGRATIDWKDPEAMRELTRVMLRHDFGIEWDVPLDRLCPPVANRLNYICWLSDLMKLGPPVLTSGGDGNGIARAGEGINRAPAAGEVEQLSSGSSRVGETETSSTSSKKYEMSVTADEQKNGDGGGNGNRNGNGVGSVLQEVKAMLDEDQNNEEAGRRESTKVPPNLAMCRGIDIGTGASCIYPLLGAKVAGWSFLATETDVISAEWAGMNVRANELQDQIMVRVVPDATLDDDAMGGAAAEEEGPGPLLTALQDRDGNFDFTMTNPPFFASEKEAGQNPDSATGAMATKGEVACPGGEEAFVRAIIRDSLELKQRVRWYTSMIGRKSNAKKLLRVLREAGVKNTRTTEFFQGKTVRWGLAWSFTSEGTVGDKVPDDPSIKVFSKKKTVERMQQNLRSFSVPLRPAAATAPAAAAQMLLATAASARGRGWGSTEAGENAVMIKIVVPQNLPKDAREVVARMRSSLGSFKQANIHMKPADDGTDTNDGDIHDGAIGDDDAYRFRCCAYPPSPPSSSSTQLLTTGGSAPLGAPSAVAAASAGPTEKAGWGAAGSAEGSGSRLGSPLLFAFQLEVHGAAQWAGTAAVGAPLQVWARLEDGYSGSGAGSGSDRAAFQRVWEHLQHDVLRQNRRWRREGFRSEGRGRGGGRGPGRG